MGAGLRDHRGLPAMSNTTGMSNIDTAKSTSEDEKVNWFAEFRDHE